MRQARPDIHRLGQGATLLRRLPVAASRATLRRSVGLWPARIGAPTSLFVLFLSLWLFRAADAADASGELARLRQVWSARRSAISTVRIRARVFIQGDNGLKRLGFDEVRALLREFEGDGPIEERLRRLLCALRSAPAAQEPVWGIDEYVTDGDRMSQSSLLGSVRYVKDARADVYADVRQNFASLYLPGRSAYGTLRLVGLLREPRACPKH